MAKDYRRFLMQRRVKEFAVCVYNNAGQSRADANQVTLQNLDEWIAELKSIKKEMIATGGDPEPEPDDD